MSNIPLDLQKYVKRKIIQRTVILLLWEALLAIVLVLWGEAIVGIGDWSFAVSFLYIICLLIPIFKTNIVFWFQDKTYFGVIERSEIKTSFENERPYKPTLEGQYTATKVILTVKEEGSDKRHTVKVQEKGGANEKKGMWDAYSQRPDGAFVQNAEMRYKVGAKVFHLRGTKHVVVLPEESDSAVRCAVCGEFNKTEQATCRKCGHTLMK